MRRVRFPQALQEAGGMDEEVCPPRRGLMPGLGLWVGLHSPGGGRGHSWQQVWVKLRHEDRNACGVFKAKD